MTSPYKWFTKISEEEVNQILLEDSDARALMTHYKKLEYMTERMKRSKSTKESMILKHENMLRKVGTNLRKAEAKAFNRKDIFKIDGEFYKDVGTFNHKKAHLFKGIYKMKPRYAKIIDIVEETKPKSIVEIGTCAGKTAVAMICKALQYRERVHYIGYDLFDEITDEINDDEYNGKPNESFDEIHQFFVDVQGAYKNGRLSFELHKGDTNKILKDHKADIVWLDGGHSVETIRNDFEHVKESKIVIFDDYYDKDNNPNNVDIEKYGCNVIVDELDPDDVEIFMQHLNSDEKSDIDGYVGIAIWRNPDYKDKK